MKVIDPGHLFELSVLDGDTPQRLQFVKRMGEKFPGNRSAYCGTTIQEVLRAVISRIKYLDGQIHDCANGRVIEHLRASIEELEKRAAKRHMRQWHTPMLPIEEMATCPHCLHIGCQGVQ